MVLTFSDRKQLRGLLAVVGLSDLLGPTGLTKPMDELGVAIREKLRTMPAEEIFNRCLAEGEVLAKV